MVFWFLISDEAVTCCPDDFILKLVTMFKICIAMRWPGVWLWVVFCLFVFCFVFFFLRQDVSLSLTLSHIVTEAGLHITMMNLLLLLSMCSVYRYVPL